ncbi:MAG: pilin [Patescibacteria group bacterium]|nr:pilin [Patescibacteria group bacterium]
MIRIFLIVSILLLPLGSAFAADFNLISPLDEASNVDVGDEIFSWEHSLGGATYYKLQLHKPGNPWINENIPLFFCGDNKCEIQPTAFNVVNLNYSDKYDWKIVAYNSADNPIGNSQEWSFTTKQAPTQIISPSDPDPGPGPVNPPASGIFQIENPISSNTLPELIGKLLNFVFGLSIVIAPLVVLYAGFLMLTAAGDSAKIQKARSILIWTVVAFAIILVAKGAPDVIRSIL